MSTPCSKLLPSWPAENFAHLIVYQYRPINRASYTAGRIALTNRFINYSRNILPVSRLPRAITRAANSSRSERVRENAKSHPGRDWIPPNPRR